MPVQRRWPSRLAALISLTLVGCAQGDATTTPAATQEVPPTPIVVIVTATPTPTPLPGRPPDTPTPIIIVVTATPSPAAAPLSSATGVPSPTPSSTALPLPTQTTPTPEATATVTPAPTPTEVTTSIPTPTPTPTSEATAAVPPTPTSTAPSAPTPTPIVAAPLSQVVLQTVNLETEVVTIVNLGNAPQNMTGWMLISEVGGQAFRFPSGYTLAPGATVLVTSGPNGHLAPPAVLQWLKSDGTPSRAYVWNNDGDMALLTDADGNTVSRFP